jgi:hypothetical protein
MESNGNLDTIPRFENSHDDDIRVPLINAIHEGAIQFVRDYLEKFGDVTHLHHIGPELAERNLSVCFQEWSQDDIKLFQNQKFQDLVGGLSNNLLFDDLMPNSNALSRLNKSRFKTFLERILKKSETFLLSPFLNDKYLKKIKSQRYCFYRDSKHFLMRLYGYIIQSNSI